MGGVREVVVVVVDEEGAGKGLEAGPLEIGVEFFGGGGRDKRKGRGWGGGRRRGFGLRALVVSM